MNQENHMNLCVAFLHVWNWLKMSKFSIWMPFEYDLLRESIGAHLRISCQSTVDTTNINRPSPSNLYMTHMPMNGFQYTCAVASYKGHTLLSYCILFVCTYEQTKKVPRTMFWCWILRTSQIWWNFVDLKLFLISEPGEMTWKIVCLRILLFLFVYLSYAFILTQLVSLYSFSVSKWFIGNRHSPRKIALKWNMSFNMLIYRSVCKLEVVS